MPDRVLTTDLYPYVEKAFSNSANIKKYETILGKYIDKNATQLSAIGPMENIIFTDDDKQPIFDLIGITDKEVKDIKAKSKSRKTKDNLIESPFSTLMAAIIRYFDIKGEKDEKMLKLKQLSILYLAMSMYPFIYKRSFPYPPIENVMAYTINNLSEKYKIKQSGNLMTTIIDIASGAYELHKKGIVSGDDVSYTDFIFGLKTRLSSFIKNIAKEFYKNHEEGKYLNTEVEINDGENFREADSSIYLISRKVDDISLQMIVNGPSIKLITMAAKVNKVSVNELRNYINTMLVNEYHNEIKIVIEAILQLFLIDNKNDIDDINSDKFMIYCLDVYKKANTTDPNITKIKTVLDEWLTRLGTYKKTQRVATINNFRRALFTFFVMCIMKYNK